MSLELTSTFRPIDRVWLHRVRPIEPPRPALASDPLARDTDGDGIPDYIDNCPTSFNPRQQDLDGNGIGDDCPSQNRARRAAARAARLREDDLQETLYGYAKPGPQYDDRAWTAGIRVDYLV